jgi:hypothetical protein
MGQGFSVSHAFEIFDILKTECKAKLLGKLNDFLERRAPRKMRARNVAQLEHLPIAEAKDAGPFPIIGVLTEDGRRSRFSPTHEVVLDKVRRRNTSRKISHLVWEKHPYFAGSGDHFNA